MIIFNYKNSCDLLLVNVKELIIWDFKIKIIAITYKIIILVYVLSSKPMLAYMIIRYQIANNLLYLF